MSQNATATAPVDERASYYRIVSRSHHRLGTIVLREHTLGLVEAGRKRLFCQDQQWEILPGQLFVLAKGSCWDVINDPPPGGSYQARIVNLSAAVNQQFQQHYGPFSMVPMPATQLGISDNVALREAFLRATDSLAAAVDSIALQQLRLMEVLLQLVEQERLLLPMSPRLRWSERLQQRVLAAPDHPWTTEQLASALATSASTLNRRLAAEGQSVANCVRDVRLDVALTRLQSSDSPIALIAQDVGYGSASKFSAAFRRRYGVLPSQVRDSDVTGINHEIRPRTDESCCAS